MLARKYKSTLISILNPIEGIFTLEFESQGNSYKYLPGQFLHLTLDKDYDGHSQWPDSRCFSMRSSPGDKTIKITYSVKGSFTKEMENSLQVGSEVWLKLPYGDLFQQPHCKNNTVFIAGGTGITPFLSLFNHESFSYYINPKIYLGFRSKAYNIYQQELIKIFNPSKSLSYFFENENGILDVQRIFDENGITSYYFISGPQKMIEIFSNILFGKGVPLNNILTDDWE